MAKKVSVSNRRRWPVFSDFSHSVQAVKRDSVDVQIDGFDSPEAKPKRSFVTEKENGQCAHISQPEPSQPLLVFDRLPDPEFVHISQPESSQSASEDQSSVINISQSDPIDSSACSASDQVNISQLEPDDLPYLESPKNICRQPIPKNRSEPVVRAKISFPKNGLANRLSILLQQQQSDAAVWNHRMKHGTQMGRAPMNLVLKKQIQENESCVMCECEKIAETTESRAVLVIFRMSTWLEYGLEEGKRFMIFAPYLQMEADKFLMPVIVGPVCLQMIG